MDLEEALTELLGTRWKETEVEAALEAGIREAWRRRVVNTESGGELIRRCRELGWSWREIERRTSVPSATARRWAVRPGVAEGALEELLPGES